MIDLFNIKRRDTFTMGDRTSSRGYHTQFEELINLCIDKIWKDTQKFDYFIEGLNVVYLTELLCLYHKKGEGISSPLCSQNGKVKNACLFLKGAKAALHSNYTLFRYG